MQIVAARNDGGVTLFGFAPSTLSALAAAPDQLGVIVEAEIRQWHQSSGGQRIVSWRAMPDEAIPADRTFRNAWHDTTPERVIDIDMVKARDIWRDVMRAVRKPLLEALDLAVMRASETNQPLANLVKQKQALRDVTTDPAIEAAQTPDELRAVWPDILKR